MANAIDKKITPFFAYAPKGDDVKRVKIIAVSRRQSHYGDGYYLISDKDEQFRNVIRHTTENVKLIRKIASMRKQSDALQEKAEKMSEEIDRQHASAIFFETVK